jgi:hypothetical protein
LNTAEHKRTNNCDGDCRNACKNEGPHDPPPSILQNDPDHGPGITYRGRCQAIDENPWHRRTDGNRPYSRGWECTPLGRWLKDLLARAHRNVVIVALANKLARNIFLGQTRESRARPVDQQHSQVAVTVFADA